MNRIFHGTVVAHNPRLHQFRINTRGRWFYPRGPLPAMGSIVSITQTPRGTLVETERPRSLLRERLLR